MYNYFMEDEFCKKCGKCCSNIPIDMNQRIMYRDGMQSISEQFFGMLSKVSQRGEITFFKCKYLINNKCTNINKPEECSGFPSSPFAYLPPDCGYEGKIFLELEKLKQKIRKTKEEIMHYKVLITVTKDKTSQNSYQKIIKKLSSFIKKYEKYGSEDW